ncbi:MAG: aminotransferase, partial [Gammaproteobacteria bacterium]
MESVMESNRVGGMEEFHVMRVMALAEQLEKEGMDIIHMEVGEPDFRAPDAVKNAAISAIEGGAT